MVIASVKEKLKGPITVKRSIAIPADDLILFPSSKDELYVNEDGLIVGFKPESEGISLEEAYKKVKKLWNM